MKLLPLLILILSPVWYALYHQPGPLCPWWADPLGYRHIEYSFAEWQPQHWPCPKCGANLYRAQWTYVMGGEGETWVVDMTRVVLFCRCGARVVK